MNRLDAELVKRGLATSRERAKEYISAGYVSVNGNVAEKPSEKVSDGDDIKITGETLKYVGRGGLKLERALSEFKIDLRGLTCLDIGASTGGFTDCMLKSGAKKVYAVDVGHDQLAKPLREDSRVVNIEGVNAKDISPEMFDDPIDFVSADLSFISARFAADAAKAVLPLSSHAVVLIKPQFEAGRQNLSKGGIVRSLSAHVSVLSELCGYFSSLGFEVSGLIPSPIKGGDGNAEYLAHLINRGAAALCDFDFKKIAARALGEKG